jgi:hypothetical protein
MLEIGKSTGSRKKKSNLMFEKIKKAPLGMRSA